MTQAELIRMIRKREKLSLEVCRKYARLWILAAKKHTEPLTPADEKFISRNLGFLNSFR